jgi:ATP-dependent protease ClpP protease subunit
MDLTPLVCAYGAQVGTLEINTDISEASAIEIEKHLERLFGYYHYEQVMLRINSPGGAVIGLEHILDCVQRWRNAGRSVQTLAMFRASSAAAMLMSLGEVGSRTAHRNTSLLYHHARVGSNAYTLTSGVADKLAAVLKGVDQGLVQRLVNHCNTGFGGGQGLAVEGALRCQMLHTQGLEIAQELGVSEERRPLKWQKAVTRMWADCQARQTLAPYTKLLTARLEEDASMDLREAWAMGLLDRVKGVARLETRLPAAPAQVPVPPRVRLASL